MLGKGVEYPKDRQGYSWAKKDDEWYYWNGSAWLPGTPPPEIEPERRAELPVHAIAAAVLVVLMLGGVAWLFLTAPPPEEPLPTGVCGCLGEGCTEKPVALEIPQEAVAYARRLGAEVEGNVIVAQGTEYAKGNIVVALVEPSPGFAAYQHILLSEWEAEGEANGFAHYRSGGTTAAVRPDAIVVAVNGEAADYVKCAKLINP